MASPCVQPCVPNGLELLLDYVTPDEEAALLGAVDGCTWTPLRKRRVQHHGHRFVYGANVADPAALDTPMPPFVQALAARFCAEGITSGWVADQCTVNDYEPGDGIPPHVDTHSVFEETLLSLSLGSAVTMDFRTAARTATASVVLPPRSLLVLNGDARYGWQHSIAERKSDERDKDVFVQRERRVSLTFRKLREVPYCDCEHIELCDLRAQRRSDT